jgi:disulfide bond formation protein DsbB
MNKINRNTLSLFMVLIAVLGMGFALYAEHALGMKPCPLCIFQRIALMAVGVMALLAWFTQRVRCLQSLLLLASTVFALAGLGFSSWQVYLQYFVPEDKLPSCGPGLAVMVNALESSAIEYAEFFSMIFNASGECAEIKWTFLGLSLPFWTGVLFLGLTMISLTAWCRQRR